MRSQADTLHCNTQGFPILEDVRTEWTTQEDLTGNPLRGLFFGILFALPFWGL
ncbi:hypothetical protein [Muricoccus vinaceus]|uniref:Uncharacterized protein n=1 Tax=Muricoccus vinaceus TaxID=424704 RepID=A0ABV6IRF7_9PROT